MIPSARLRQVERAVGWVAAAGLGVAALSRLSPNHPHRIGIGLQGIAYWLLLPAYPLAVWAAFRRFPGLAVTATALAALQTKVARDSLGRDRPDPLPPGSTRLRLVTANVLLSNPVMVELGQALACSDADVIALQELTDDHLAALRRGGLLGAYPHHILDPEPGFAGSAVLSRLPFASSAVIDVEGSPMTEAVIRVGDGLVTVLSVHATNPGTGQEEGRWRRQLLFLARYADDCPTPVVLAGDFNATLDHRPLRDLLGHRLRDAFSVAGRGLGATWPSWRRPLFPVMRLDHVLVGPGITIHRVATRESAGSDHHRVEVELALPAAP